MPYCFMQGIGGALANRMKGPEGIEAGNLALGYVAASRINR
jgi:hypothetical protein